MFCEATSESSSYLYPSTNLSRDNLIPFQKDIKISSTSKINVTKTQINKDKFTSLERFSKIENMSNLNVLNFMKNQMKANDETQTKTLNHFGTNRKPTPVLQKVPRNLSRPNLRNNQEVYKSHEKVPSNYRPAKDLFKIAKIEPVRVDQSRMKEKTKLCYNFYNKQDRYFYCSQINIKSFVRSIYYNGNTLDSLDEIRQTTFKRIENHREFFDTISQEGKAFVSSANKYILSQIDKVIHRNIDHLSNGRLELTFVAFLKHSKTYERVINNLYNHFKHLDHVFNEIEKLIRLYIEFSLRKSSFEGGKIDMHSRLFINHIYNNGLIFRFFEHLSRMFKLNQFYDSKYPHLSEKVSDIYEKSIHYINELNHRNNNVVNENSYSNSNDIDSTLQSTTRNQNTQWSQRTAHVQIPNSLSQTYKTREIQEINYKLTQINIENEMANQSQANETVNKKKKKKRNKKKTETQNVSCEEKQTETKNDNSIENKRECEPSHDAHKLKKLEEILSEADSKYMILPNMRIKIQFCSKEKNVLTSYAKGIRG